MSIVYETTVIGGQKVVTKGPLWSGSSTMLGSRPRIIDDHNAVYVMGDGLMRHPPEYSFKGGSDWDTVERPGLKPMVRRKGPKLRRMTWKLSVGHRDWKRPVDASAYWLLARAEWGRKIRFAGHGSPRFEHGMWWVIEDCDVNVTRRTPTGDVSRAEVTIQLVEAQDVPTTPAKKPKPKPKPKPKRKPKSKPIKLKKKQRVHVMKRGDTLWGLARRYYGRPTKWPVLAKRNKIKNVRRIPVGKRIIIP